MMKRDEEGRSRAKGGSKGVLEKEGCAPEKEARSRKER